MKFLLKFFMNIFIVLLIVVFARNILAKFIVERGVKALTGLDLRIEDVDIGISDSTLSVKNLTLFNPRGFEDPLMLQIPEIFFHYDLQSFLKRKTHLYELRLSLKEFLVVKNKNGALNLDALKALKVSSEEKEKKVEPEPQKKAPGSFAIDELNFKIGKVVYKDYSKEPAGIREFNINSEEHFSGVTDPRALVRLIVVRALAKTTIADLTSLNLKDLQESLTGSVWSISEGVLDTTVDILKKTTQGITDFLKKPFEKPKENETTP